MTETYKIEIVHRIPVIEKNGAKWMVDIGCPCSYPKIQLQRTSQDFHGIPGLRVMGLDMLRRYTKIDYAEGEITTSDEPLEIGGESVTIKHGLFGCFLVPMSVGGKAHDYYIDTGAAYSYVHDLDSTYEPAGTIQDNGFSGRTWSAPIRRTPCVFDGRPFEILCADAFDNGEAPRGQAVPPEGVIGYEFFQNFSVIIDRESMTVAYRASAHASSD